MASATPFWRPDASLIPPTSGSEKYVLAPAGAEDTEKVLGLFSACSIPGHDVTSVLEVSSPALTESFHGRLAQLQCRNGNPHFQPQYSSTRPRNLWQHQSSLPGARFLVLNDTAPTAIKTLAQPFSDADFPDVSIVPVFHGTNASVVPSILNGNLANLASTDGGFFGKGVYGTPDAEYAWRVYAKRGGRLLLCCFSFYSAYPVIGVREMRKLEGKPNHGNYDAHVVPVVPLDPQNPNEAVYHPAEAGGASLSTYMELVVFDSSQSLPRFIVEVAPSRIPRPLCVSGVIPREVPLQYAQLFAGRSINGPEVLRVLAALRIVDEIKASMQQGEAQRISRLKLIRDRKIDERVQLQMQQSTDVTVGDEIGFGAHGVVYRAQYMGLEVALKRIKSSTPQLESHLKREALLMMRVSNPYIVRVLGMLPNPLSIIMELVQAGSLYDILRKRTLSFEEQFNICRGVTHGLKVLHAAGIWHCDLKGKNVLVDDHGVPKITDFGIARAHGPSDTLAGSSGMALAGTIEWMAPELFKKPPEFSAASDTYALGILFFEILTRETPWAKELKGEEPFARVPGWVLDGRRPQYGTVDAGLAGVMISCWKQKPNERPSLGQILEMLEAESPAARAKSKAAADAAAKAAADAAAKAAADAAAKAAADAASKAAADTAHLQQHHVRVQCPEGAQTYQAVRFPGIFVGDIDLENNPHGPGVFTFTDDSKQNLLTGAVLSGSFSHGVAQGFCELKRGTRAMYCGEFDAGLMHGRGRLFKKDGSLFHDGQFERGRLINGGSGNSSCSLQ